LSASKLQTANCLKVHGVAVRSYCRNGPEPGWVGHYWEGGCGKSGLGGRGVLLGQGRCKITGKVPFRMVLSGSQDVFSSLQENIWDMIVVQRYLSRTGQAYPWIIDLTRRKIGKSHVRMVDKGVTPGKSETASIGFVSKARNSTKEVCYDRRGTGAAASIMVSGD
jgi:hypothetical protein